MRQPARVCYIFRVGRKGVVGPRVLVVDDETGIANMLAERLQVAGYVPMVAESARRAMELVRTRAPDVILTDHYMPEVDGATFVRELRDEGYDIPVIMMSAGIDGELVALRAHAAGFLAKPFPMGDAISAIEAALCASRAEPR